MPLELWKNRILPIRIGKQTYTYTVKPITREQWLAYFDSVVVEQKIEDGVIVNVSENDSARLELLGKALVGVQGYATPNNQPLSEIPDWQNLIPVGHRSAVADLLFDVGEGSSALSGPAMLGAERIALRASWGQEEEGGSIVAYAGLIHTFRVPTVEQQRRYSRDSSRSRVTGGRRGTTRFLGAQRTLVQLYDELIVSVEGYSANGEPLNNRTDLIVSSMDTYHKTQAAGMIFSPPAAELEEDAD